MADGQPQRNKYVAKVAPTGHQIVPDPRVTRRPGTGNQIQSACRGQASRASTTSGGPSPVPGAVTAYRPR